MDRSRKVTVSVHGYSLHTSKGSYACNSLGSSLRLADRSKALFILRSLRRNQKQEDQINYNRSTDHLIATFTPDLSTNVVLSILPRAFMTSCCSISKSSYFSPNMIAIKDKYVCEEYGTIDSDAEEFYQISSGVHLPLLYRRYSIEITGS